MESITFIKQELNNLFAQFPKLEFRYEYRNSIQLHIIEVKPESAYKQDSLYINSEIEFEQKFTDLFPKEEILFITETSLTQINNPILELKVERITYSLTLSFPSYFSNSNEEEFFDECEDYFLAA